MSIKITSNESNTIKSIYYKQMLLIKPDKCRLEFLNTLIKFRNTKYYSTIACTDFLKIK